MIGENWLKVATTAMALGVGLYVIPLGMIANPDILKIAETPLAAMVAFVRMAVGLAVLSHGLIAMRALVSKILVGLAGLAIILSGLVF